MRIASISERYRFSRFERVHCCDICSRRRAARLRRLVFLAIGLCYEFLSPTSRANIRFSNERSRQVLESHQRVAKRQDMNPTRTLQNHTVSGNRTVDNQSIQRRGANGDFEAYQDIEKTTVQVNTTTVRTTTRTFGRDSNGAKTLVQVTEEEARTVPGGGSNIVRTTSNPDANGNLQLVQRQIDETKKISKDVEETKTTVMLPSINGDLAPAMKTQERRERSANDTVTSQKTTLLPDGTGNWQESETRQATTRQDGKERTTEERISRPDGEGKLSEVSRTVSKDSENAPGKSATPWKLIPSMCRDQRGTAACTWLSAQLPRRGQAQLDSRPRRVKWSRRTLAIRTLGCA